MFEPNLAQNTNTTPSTRRNGQIHITWKLKMAVAAILDFGKMSITPDWIRISAQSFIGRSITAMQRWPRDQKSKPEVNLRDVRSISASISVTITYIWIKFDTELKYHTINTPEWWNSHSLKIKDVGLRHLGFLGYVERKMSISRDWIKIST